MSYTSTLKQYKLLFISMNSGDNDQKILSLARFTTSLQLWLQKPDPLDKLGPNHAVQETFLFECLTKINDCFISEMSAAISPQHMIQMLLCLQLSLGLDYGKSFFYKLARIIVIMTFSVSKFVALSVLPKEYVDNTVYNLFSSSISNRGSNMSSFFKMISIILDEIELQIPLWDTQYSSSVSQVWWRYLSDSAFCSNQKDPSSQDFIPFSNIPEPLQNQLICFIIERVSIHTEFMVFNPKMVRGSVFFASMIDFLSKSDDTYRNSACLLLIRSITQYFTIAEISTTKEEFDRENNHSMALSYYTFTDNSLCSFREYLSLLIDEGLKTFSEWIGFHLIEIGLFLKRDEFLNSHNQLKRLRLIFLTLVEQEFSESVLLSVLVSVQRQFIQSYPYLCVQLFLLLIFDIKNPNPNFWELFEQVLISISIYENGKLLISDCCYHFINHLSIVFSPIFFDISIENVTSIINPNDSDPRKAIVNQSILIFENPVLFSETIVIPQMSNYEYKSLSNNFGFFYLSLDRKQSKWDQTSLILFVRTLFDIIDGVLESSLSHYFVFSLLHVQNGLSKSLPLKSEFLVNSYLSIFLNQLDDSDSILEFDVFGLCVQIFQYSCLKEYFDQRIIILWLKAIIRFLVCTKQSYILIALKASFQSLYIMYPVSFCLIPFSIYALKYLSQNMDNFSTTFSVENCNLLLSSLSICSMMNEFKVGNDVLEAVESWSLDESSNINISLMGEVLSLINSVNHSFSTIELSKVTLTLLGTFFTIGRFSNLHMYSIPFILLGINQKIHNIEILEASISMFKAIFDSIDSLKDRITIMRALPFFVKYYGLEDDLCEKAVDSLIRSIENVQSVKEKWFDSVLTVIIDIIIKFPSTASKFINFVQYSLSANKWGSRLYKKTSLIHAIEFLFCNILPPNRRKAPIHSSAFAFHNSNRIHVIERTETNTILTTKNPYGSYTSAIECIKYEDRPKTREFFDYDQSTKIDLIDPCFYIGFCSNHSSDLESLYINPESFDYHESPISIKLDNPSSNETTKSDMPEFYHYETLFNEKFLSSPYALFFHLLYDTKDSDFCIKAPNQKINRHIQSIFAIEPIEYAKIGVIYVGAGQKKQNSILANNWGSTSAMFKSFLESIGCFVDLSCSDDKYTGKLDCNRFSNGKYSLRFFTQRFDVMYHVAPMMPTESDDAQQLRKKRHIGNDHVHIVWSEDSNDYDPTTIVSNFNDAHIVIYPLSDDLFRVVTHNKEAKTKVYPLFGDCIVPAHSLGILVQWTAFFADRSLSTDEVGQIGQFEESLMTSMNAIRTD